MNLIDESLEPNKQKDTKKTTTIILVFMAILVIAIIATYIAIIYIKDSALVLYLNGNQNDKVKEMMVTENNGDIYFPIKDIAAYFGYESFNGDYTDKSEDASKCYVQCEDEVANFALNSNKIYTLTLSGNNAKNYDYFYASKPVKAINGKLYATADTIEKAFNVSFTYDTQKQKIYIYTMPYLVNIYSSRILDYGYEKISDDFVSKKTVFNDMLVVTKDEDKIYAVIDIKGNAIIEPKYDYIKYLPNSGDFLVKSNNKVGIISSGRETKVQLIYDSLTLIDNDSGLYLARRDNKYGVIDSRGTIKIYIEYDQIGIDNTKFEQNEIKNGYLLDNGMIPARKDKLWGAFNKDGKQILNFEYDDFGYIATTSRDAINLLLIPDYNILVAAKNKKYTIINKEGVEMINPIIDDIYMTISSGKKYYYMNVMNQKYNVEELLESQGVEPENKKSNKNDTKNNSTNETSTKTENTTNKKNEVVNNASNSDDETQNQTENEVNNETQEEEETEQDVQETEE